MKYNADLGIEPMSTAGIDDFDLLNMDVSSESLQDLADGTLIEVEGIAIKADRDTDTDEKILKGFIKATNGTLYGTISETAIKAMDKIAAILEHGMEVNVVNTTGKSKSNRDFIILKAQKRG